MRLALARRDQGTAEEILLYPQPNIRIRKATSGGATQTTVSALHADGLGSPLAVTDGTGLAVERAGYRPDGEEIPGQFALGTPESKGFIGERHDEAAGLQYLNARYYDPRLGMFLQPDWWEVSEKGVGTNRYAYSFNDPVNGKDPGGHILESIWDFGFVAYDAYNLAYAYATDDEELWNQALVDGGVDLLSLATPFAPAGSTHAARALGNVPLSKVGRLAGHQTHHIAPKNMEKEFRDLFKATGFDINGQKNLIDLPIDRSFHPTATRHIGKHRDTYEEMIAERFRDIQQDLFSGRIAPTEALDRMEKVVGDVRGKLERGEISLNAASDAQPANRPDSDGPDDRRGEHGAQ